MHEASQLRVARLLLIGATLLAMAAFASACGRSAPAPESAALVSVASSPAAVRESAVVAFLRPNATPAQVAELRDGLAQRRDVERWAFSDRPGATASFATIYNRQFSMGVGTSTRQLRHYLAGELPAGAFYAIVSGGGRNGAQDDLVNWFLAHDCVFLCQYWIDDTLCGATGPIPG
jgi:hypothetical protein